LQHEQKLIREKTLIENFVKKPVNYFGIIGEIQGEKLGKFGYSNDLNKRIQAHKREIGNTFLLDCVVECEKNIELEKKFKQHQEISSRHVTRTINGKVQTELLKLDETFGQEDVQRILVSLKQTINIDRELMKMKHEERMLELSVESKRLELESKKLDLELRKLEFDQAQNKNFQGFNKKSVCKTDVNGNLIKEYNSISEAANDVGGNRNVLVAHCDKDKPYKNFYWKLK
jgi:hypothetical protein